MGMPDISTVNTAAWEEARRSLPVIRRLAENPAHTPSDILAAAAMLARGASHVYQLLRRYLSDPRLTSLLPRARP